MTGEQDKDRGFKVVDRRGVESEPPPEEKEPPPAPKEPPRAAPPLEIDFATFILSLASSALIHLGELPGPGGPDEQPPRDLALAKQTIDILGVLAEKTRGNLTDDEARLLEHLLYDLRLKYVEAKKRG